MSLQEGKGSSGVKASANKGEKITSTAHHPEARTPKLLQSMEPDLIVVVGGIEFHHYKSILCNSCNYFDAMLSAGMREQKTNRIEFPDKDPAEWEIVYSFLDPSNDPDEPSIQDRLLAQKNVPMLCIWYDFLGLEKLAKLCDKLLVDKFKNTTDGGVQVATCRKTYGHANLKRSMSFWTKCKNAPCPETNELVKNDLMLELTFWSKNWHSIESVELIQPLLVDPEHGAGFWNALAAALHFPADFGSMNRAEVVANPLFCYFVLATDSMTKNGVVRQ